MPRFTVAQIEAEIDESRPASAYYLHAELRRRVACKGNTGPPVTRTDKRAVQMREATRRWRERKTD